MVLEEAEIYDFASDGVEYDGVDYDGDLLCRSMISCAKDVVEELGENAAEDIADRVIEEVIDATIPDVPVDAPGTTCALPNSFVPGTPVLMADGSTKPIEKVEAGDEVVATDPATGRTESRPVLALISSKGVKKLVDITVTVDGAKDVITATDNHPFWVPKRKAWLTAGALQPGMWLQTSAGTYVQITAVAHRTATQRVHNLTVEDFHTYHVVAGTTPVLVHNSNGTCPTNLQPGNSKAAARGTRVHNGPEWGEHLDPLGYKPGNQISPNSIPDGFTPDDFPVELKPNTKSGIKAGTRQLRRYMNEMGVDYGELWAYRDTPDGVVFDLVRVPNGSRRWMKW